MYRVEVTHSKDQVFNFQSQNHPAVVIDAKGKEGLTPPDLLLASLGSCVGVYLRKYSESSGLELDNFKVTAEAEFSPSPYGFKEIHVTVNLKELVLDERRKKALLEFVKNCPVHNTLKGNPAVLIKIT